MQIALHNNFFTVELLTSEKLKRYFESFFKNDKFVQFYACFNEIHKFVFLSS